MLRRMPRSSPAPVVAPDRAGVDSDRTLAYAGNTLHANVVHRFTKPSRVVQVRLAGRDHSNDQVTAIEVDRRTNTPTSF